MIAKRLAAVATALLLVVGAYALRANVIDGADTDDEPTDAGVLVCPPELAGACRSVDLPDGMELRIEETGDTLDALASDDPEPVVWLTYGPFPAALDQLRRAGGRAPLDTTVDPLASSPLALVTTDADLGCGDPVDWRCLGDGDATVGFAADPDSGIGLLGATAAATGFAGGGSAPFGDALFEVWLRGLLTSVGRSQLSGGTAIATIQVRPSAMDVAVGAEAELSEDRRDRFEVLYAGPMVDADAILATSGSTSAPDGLADRLADALRAGGWSGPTTVEDAQAASLLATRDFWRDL